MDIGEMVEDFELPSSTGGTWRLSERLKDGPVVLFFYPRAMTPGCTAESCHFRDLKGEFEELGAQRVGISNDSVERQQQFTEKHSFDFPLLTDRDRSIAKRFGVKRPGPLFNRRATFVIGADGRLAAEVHSEFATDKHADEALAALRHLPAS